MSSYRPASPFTTPVKLLIPEWKNVKGVRKKVFPEDGPLLWCSFKTYGGTERNTNDVYAVEDTAKIETWYRPDIKSDCSIMLVESGAAYEILGAPEDINQRHQFCTFKVRRLTGGA